MIIGILQFELAIPGAESLKDKRRVVKSIKDRVHREHMASVAETAALESPGVAVMGLAVVGNDGQRLGQTLDRITEKLRALHDAELVATRREFIRGADPDDAVGAAAPHDPGDSVAAELLDYADPGRSGTTEPARIDGGRSPDA